ncbi:hypothetical protein B9D94_28055 [Paenibacillus sp. Cedars]|nr:hypothetical protein B9D94_28055 [Paenibacillus sp. Cedars]
MLFLLQPRAKPRLLTHRAGPPGVPAGVPSEGATPIRKSKPNPIAAGLDRGGLLFLLQPRGEASAAHTQGWPTRRPRRGAFRGGPRPYEKASRTPIAVGLDRGGLLFLFRPGGEASATNGRC